MRAEPAKTTDEAKPPRPDEQKKEPPPRGGVGTGSILARLKQWERSRARLRSSEPDAPREEGDDGPQP